MRVDHKSEQDILSLTSTITSNSVFFVVDIKDLVVAVFLTVREKEKKRPDLLLKNHNVCCIFCIITIEMDDTYDPRQPADDDKDDATLYIDCIRLVEGGHLRRFQNIAAKFDVVRYELNDGPGKSLLFYAIEHNDEAFVKLLLDMEVPLEKKYSVRIFSLKQSIAFSPHCNEKPFCSRLLSKTRRYSFK